MPSQATRACSSRSIRCTTSCITSERTPRGATFETTDREPALRSDDAAFRPVYIANAPDGSLFVSDMYEFYIAHGQHYQNQIDPTTGPHLPAARQGRDAGERTSNLAAKTHGRSSSRCSPSEQMAPPHRGAAARRAQGSEGGGRSCGRLIADDDGLGALNALWALHQSAGLDDATALVGAATSPTRRCGCGPRGCWATNGACNRNLGSGQHARSPRRPALPATVFDALLAQAADRDGSPKCSRSSPPPRGASMRRRRCRSSRRCSVTTRS